MYAIVWISIFVNKLLMMMMTFSTYRNKLTEFEWSFEVCKFYWPASATGSGLHLSSPRAPQQPAFASFRHKRNHGPRLSPSKTLISVNCLVYSLCGEYIVVAVADEQMRRMSRWAGTQLLTEWWAHWRMGYTSCKDDIIAFSLCMKCKGGWSANKIRKLQIRKFADLNNLLDF